MEGGHKRGLLQRQGGAFSDGTTPPESTIISYADISSIGDST